MPTIADATITIRRTTWRKIHKLARDEGRKLYAVVDRLVERYERQEREQEAADRTAPTAPESQKVEA